jgi:hypothetical protein
MGTRTRTSDFKRVLTDKMEEMARANTLSHRGAFVTYNFLIELFSKENLIEHLQTYDCVNGDSERSQLATAIQSRGLKVFAILLLLDEQWRIRALLSDFSAMNDEEIFDLEVINGQRYWSYCSLEKLKDLADLAEIAEDFYKTQWHFPPRLSPKQTLRFPANMFMFPYKKVNIDMMGYGSFGMVKKVKIPRGYLSDLDFENQVSLRKR